MSDKNNHAGHRQRLKKKAKKFGLKALEQHEILELMLTYAIPRKDTNELAHSLLNTFGSISDVVDADMSRLKLIKGIGEESALFFKVLSEFIDVYLENASNQKSPKLDSVDKLINYFREHYRLKKTEHFYCFCLNKSSRLMHHFTVESGEETEVNFSFKTLIDNISGKEVKQVIVVHTHPNGSVNPSAEDVASTKRINSVCYMLGVQLLDHLIVNETEFYSFRQSGYITPITYEQANEVIKDLGIVLNRTI